VTGPRREQYDARIPCSHLANGTDRRTGGSHIVLPPPPMAGRGTAQPLSPSRHRSHGWEAEFYDERLPVSVCPHASQKPRPKFTKFFQFIARPMAARFSSHQAAFRYMSLTSCFVADIMATRKGRIYTLSYPPEGSTYFTPWCILRLDSLGGGNIGPGCLGWSLMTTTALLFIHLSV